MKVICTPHEMPVTEDYDLQIVLFGKSGIQTMGAVGATLYRDVEKFGIQAEPRTWDLLTVALAVGATDESCPRSTSPDGWTRVINLTVSVQDAAFWTGQSSIIEQMLRFLTGDLWTLQFTGGGTPAPRPRTHRVGTEDCVCLLSGGADSLVGAIDVARSGRRPLLVSQVASGDKDNQAEFAEATCGQGHHLQLNHNIEVADDGEGSQRGRSVIFIAYGVLAATTIEAYGRGEPVSLLIPENGFISLNVPLTPLRIGSLSTRTTHPHYIRLFQALIEAAGLRVKLLNPYQFKTKGEMAAECQDQRLIRQLICQSTSCGRFARNQFRHCGRCVPCLIRRGALLRSGIQDRTTYVFADLSRNDEDHRNFDDVRSACFAVEQVKTKGVLGWAGGALTTTQLGDLTPYHDLLQRGINELGDFLSHVEAC